MIAIIDVLCIGHAAYDLSFLLNEFPAENSKVEIENMVECGGGPASNAAFLLSSWGVSCAFAGLLGNDTYGQRIIEEFRSINVDTSLIEIRNQHQTPVSAIMVNKENGSRTIINRKVPGTNMIIDVEYLKKLQPKVLLFDGHELDASLQALEIFPEAKSILDAGSLREGTRVLAEKVDYLVASERFAVSVAGVTELRQQSSLEACLQKLKQINKRNVVVTLGERGLAYMVDEKISSMPAFSVKVLDTTGAGDIFHGAFAYGILKNLSLYDTLKISSSAAAISVTQLGGRKSVPRLDSVMEALK